MTSTPQNPKSAPKKEDSITKEQASKDKPVSDEQLDKVTGGAVDSYLYFQNSGGGHGKNK